jgi:hypothetical protein
VRLPSRSTGVVATSVVAARPDVADADIYAAAVLGDAECVHRFLADANGLATAPGGPYRWDGLT